MPECEVKIGLPIYVTKNQNILMLYRKVTMPECDQNLITNTSCICETNFANKKSQPICQGILK